MPDESFAMYIRLPQHDVSLELWSEHISMYSLRVLLSRYAYRLDDMAFNVVLLGNLSTKYIFSSEVVNG